MRAAIFADCTGDGTISVRAGCRAMVGRESKADFAEPDAPEVGDHQTMGSSIYWQVRDVGAPVSFTKPDWAQEFSKEDLALRPYGGTQWQRGFWWVETGGDTDDTIADNESIRDELWSITYGLWDFIKNHADVGAPEEKKLAAQNFVLDRVGALPGKRESRRIVGEYILREQDLLAGRVFEDAVAYGGWTMDLHFPGGIRHLDQKPNVHISHGLYTFHGVPWLPPMSVIC